jgi:hypothetical protein
MSLLLNEEQSMLRDSARSFMAEQAPVAQLRALRDANDEAGFSREVWAKFAELGFTGILIPEAHGGLGLGFVEAGTVMEEIGRNLTASPFLPSSVVAATLIMQAGTDAQKARWLPALANGSLIATLALEEHAKHAPERIALQSGPATVSLRHAGSVAVGGTPVVVMDLAGAQAHFSALGRLTRIDLRLAAGVDRDRFRDRLREALPLPAGVLASGAAVDWAKTAAQWPVPAWLALWVDRRHRERRQSACSFASRSCA